MLVGPIDYAVIDDPINIAIQRKYFLWIRAVGVCFIDKGLGDTLFVIIYIICPIIKFAPVKRIPDDAFIVDLMLFDDFDGNKSICPGRDISKPPVPEGVVFIPGLLIFITNVSNIENPFFITVLPFLLHFYL